MTNNKKFKICLTLAGAVSAGAYTAGVMDYLLETLELWEQAKNKNRMLGKKHPEYDFSVPMHDVELDVISGASAGGITASLALLNLIDAEYQPVNQDNPSGKNNRLYQSWVEMGDDESATTFEKLLDTSDLKELAKGDKPQALLNTAPIDLIADRAIRIENLKNYPAYVSHSLDLVLTTTNLDGINFKINFNGNDQSGSVITSHAAFFRYKLANKQFKKGIPNGEELYYVLDLNQPDHLNHLREATLSTASFPIALKPRDVSIPQKYIARYPKYIFGTTTGIQPILPSESDYQYHAIDGGLINNEPFALALKIFREKSPIQFVKEQYAIIMVDPFPNKDHNSSKEVASTDVISVVKRMFKSLRNEVMFNRSGILDAINTKNNSKFLIEPVRKHRVDGVLTRAENDLATAPLSGFAGFIDKSFRKHDFELGRLNCQTFLRYHFTLPEETLIEKLNNLPTAKALNRFEICVENLVDKKCKHFPIIPDLRVLKASTNEADHANFGSDAHLDFPEYPSITEAYFYKKHQKNIRKRLELLTNRLVTNFWFSVANKLFIKNKLSKKIETVLLDKLKEAQLIK